MAAASTNAQRDKPLPRPPGVYFEFVGRSAPSARRRSDIAGFVGLTLRLPRDPTVDQSEDARECRRAESSARGRQGTADGQDCAPPAQPARRRKVWRCDRLADFHDLFGKPRLIDPEPIASTSRTGAPALLPVSQQQHYLEAAIRGFFANGGQTCFVAARATPGEQPVIAASELLKGFNDSLEELGNVDAVSLLVVPGAVDLPDEHKGEIWREMILQAETLRDRVALIDPPHNFDPRSDALNVQSPSGLAAVYWPWLKVADEQPRTRSAPADEVPPCGHIAGTIARRDLTRGPFAPPANLVIEGALGVTDALTPEARERANKNGINVLVATPGRGVRAMGARTLLADTNDPFAWLNVRRLVTHLAEWIDEDTQWTVFEPQGEVLYRAIERTVRTILFDLWRRGGLVGATDDEAYFVRCDATTNPPEEAERGRVICLVGVRPPVPAEMIFVRLGIAEGRVELMDREFADG